MEEKYSTPLKDAESRLYNCIIQYWPGASLLVLEQKDKETKVRARVQVPSKNIDEACIKEYVPLRFHGDTPSNLTQIVGPDGGHGDGGGGGRGCLEVINYCVSFRMRIPERLAIFRAKKGRRGWEGLILAKVLNTDKTLNKLLKSWRGTPRVEMRGMDINVPSRWGYGINMPSKDVLQAIDLIAGHVCQLSKK